MRSEELSEKYLLVQMNHINYIIYWKIFKFAKMLRKATL